MVARISSVLIMIYVGLCAEAARPEERRARAMEMDVSSHASGDNGPDALLESDRAVSNETMVFTCLSQCVVCHNNRAVHIRRSSSPIANGAKIFSALVIGGVTMASGGGATALIAAGGLTAAAAKGITELINHNRGAFAKTSHCTQVQVTAMEDGADAVFSGDAAGPFDLSTYLRTHPSSEDPLHTLQLLTKNLDSVFKITDAPRKHRYPGQMSKLLLEFFDETAMFCGSSDGIKGIFEEEMSGGVMRYTGRSVGKAFGRNVEEDDFKQACRQASEEESFDDEKPEDDDNED